MAFRCLRIVALAVGILLLAAAVLPDDRQPGDPDQYFFEPSFKDLQEELQIAVEEGRAGLLIFFEMESCPFCIRMRQTVLNQPPVQDWYRKYFRNISINVELTTEATDFDGNETTEKQLAARYGVFSTPTIIFFDLNGNEFYRHTRVVESSEDFIDLGMAVRQAQPSRD